MFYECILRDCKGKIISNVSSRMFYMTSVQVFLSRAFMNTWLLASQRPGTRSPIWCTPSSSSPCRGTSRWAPRTQRRWQWRGRGRGRWRHPRWTRCCQSCAWECPQLSLSSSPRNRSWPSRSWRESKWSLLVTCKEWGVLSVARFCHVFPCELWGPAWTVGSYSTVRPACKVHGCKVNPLIWSIFGWSKAKWIFY